jgi:alpha-mannosidase
MRVALRPTSPVVEVELQFNNEASDHRLRAQFPTGVSSETVVSDGHFYINHRPIEQPLGEDWKQAPAGTYPQQEFTLVQDGERGVTLLNKGLPEIQAHRSETGGVTLSLTLIRAVGWLSRDDFDTRRRSNAGPTLYTPEAQCNGLQTLEYAVAPFVGSYIEADIKGLSQRYRTPVLTIQGVADQRVSGDSFLVQKAGRSTCVSAIKKHEVRDTLVVRLFNLTSEPVEEFLRFGVDIRQAWRVDLLEERFEALKPASDRELRVLLRPHEIATLEIRFDAASGDK